MEQNKPLRVIISGGGTGGHIFPAVSIANAIKKHHPEAEILFVGAFVLIIIRRKTLLKTKPQKLAFAMLFVFGFIKIILRII